MDAVIRLLSKDDAPAMAALVHESFLAAGSEGWAPNAVRRLLCESSAEALRPQLKQAAYAAGAFVGPQAVGFILLPRPSLLAMLFVSPQHFRRGIGRRLWEAARLQVESNYPETKTVELNATRFALPFYLDAGFAPISNEFEREGSRATRMACWLPARALGVSRQPAARSGAQTCSIRATASFYDELAPCYHLLYRDWAHSIAAQAETLAQLLRAQGIHPGDPVLDAACGIGTQTIGLVERGYRVTASDISSGAVERLRAELADRGLQAVVHVDDLRTLGYTSSASMAAVLACDNSIPHLLSDDEISAALQSCFRCLRPLGVIVLSMRDYATVARVSPDVRPYGLRREGGKRFLAVQTWEWDADQYELRLYLTSETADGQCSTRVLVTRYYAVTIDRLLELLGQAGFVDVQRLDGVLHQPVLVARRPMGA